MMSGIGFHKLADVIFVKTQKRLYVRLIMQLGRVIQH